MKVKVNGISFSAIEEPRGENDFMVSKDYPTIHLWIDNYDCKAPMRSKLLQIYIQNETSQVKQIVRDIERKYLGN